VSTRVLIAGCGYVGTQLAHRLVQDGETVFALTRKSRVNIEGVTAVHADLTRPESLSDALPDAIDTVLFTAASDASTDEAYRAIYVDGLKNLVRSTAAATNPPKRLIVTSSTGVYGQNNGEFVDENSETKPDRFSGQRMLECESVAIDSPYEHVLIRFGGVYGPGRTRFLNQVRLGRAPVSNRVSYTNRIHRDDCAGVLRHMLRYADPEPVYLAVDDDPADRNEVIRWMSRQFGVAPLTAARTGEGGTEGKRCSNRLLRSTGYRFRYPTFREGYKEMIDEIGLRSADNSSQ
jgi:nucleoside-diphosphate-sugar epimerase